MIFSASGLSRAKDFLACQKMVLREYARTFREDPQCQAVSDCRGIPQLSRPSSLCSNPLHYNKKATLLGSGPSVNKLLLRDELSQSLQSRHTGRFVTVLNMTVFSGIPYDACLFELTTTRSSRSSLLSLFNCGYHLPGAKPDSKFVFTHVCLDAIDDYLRNDIAVNVKLLPQAYVGFPGVINAPSTAALLLAAHAHVKLSRLGLSVPGLFIRASAVRAFLLLVAAGFDDILMIGFDGGISYYYDDEYLWPNLAELRELSSSIFNSNGKMKVMKDGFLTYKNVPKAGDMLNNTENPRHGEFTAPYLINMFADSFNIRVSYC